MADSAGYRFAIQKLNSENYPIWSYKVELLLIRDKLWTVIRDTAPSPVTEAWADKDDQARAAIGLLVEDNQLLHIKNATTAKEAWNTLKQYHQKVTAAGIVHTMKKMCRLVMKDGDDMEEHIALFTSYVDSLAALGEKISDKIQAGFLLSSLPESYDTLITALEGRLENDITPEFVKGKLIDEYKRRKGAKEIRGNSQGDAALKATHKDSDAYAKKQCFFCKKFGHCKIECRKYKAWKSKQDTAKRVTENSIQNSSNEICFLTAAEESCEKNSEMACLGAKTADGDRDSWFVDSGATSHMVNSVKFFQDLDPKRTGHVRLADDNKLAEVKGVGAGIINCAVRENEFSAMKIRDVLYVPSLASNLLSVKKLAKDGHSIIFEADECQIVKDGKLQAAAKLSPQLYEVKVAEKACVANAVIKERHTDYCQHEWHRRFGHRDLSAIKDLEAKGLATGIIIKDCGLRETCESCVKGKMSRTPFPKESSNKSREILDLIHTDVCGPMQTETPGKKRYILTRQHNKQPTTVDWNEAKRVARYLKGTKDYELRLGQRHGPKGLIGYADADWAENKGDRKSNSGYLFQYYGASISWGCRKQSCVSLSSTEAEYVALAEASQEGIWMRRLIEDFEGQTLETTIMYEDNQSCLKLIENKKFSHRTKHIDTKFHYIKDLKTKGVMDFKYCPTDEMPADMLTKALGKIKLRSLAEKSGLLI